MASPWAWLHKITQYGNRISCKSVINLQLPLSRSMPSVGSGVHELRVGDSTKTVRVFYFVKYGGAILVFHAFEKRTQKTPPHEIEIGKKRLKELLYGKE